MKKVCIMGLGYIGLPTASFLATKGFSVHGVDVRADVVQALNEGKVLIHEPSLDILVKSAVGSGRLKAAMQPEAADIFILALPTPFKDDKKPDLSHVRQGTLTIAPYLAPGNMVILESTSPVGTTEAICHWLHEIRPDLRLPGCSGGEGEQVYVAHCPERVLPGRILLELVENDRVVGGVDDASTEKIYEFYASFVQGAVLSTNSRVAELTKLTENSFRDVNIAFANELSLICDKLGVDIWETVNLANRHPRVNILRPGPGVGGHCISVDPWFLVDSAPEEARLIRVAREVNCHKPQWILERVRNKAKKFTAPVIACMGLAFKANIDDLRESPSVEIVQHLAENPHYQMLVVEPHIAALPPQLQGKPNLQLCHMDEAVHEADILLFLVEHRQFTRIKVDTLMEKIVMDICGIFKKYME